MQSKRKTNAVVGYSTEGHMMYFGTGDVSDFGITFDAAKAAGMTHEQFAAMSENGREGLKHGFKQKISDRAAIGRDPETGASASPEEKFAAMKETAERLMSGGPWNATPTGGTGSAGGLLYRAMRNLYPNAWSDRVSFAAYIAEKAISESERLKKKVTENDVRAGLGRVKRIAAEMEKIRRAEMPDVGLDANGMLQELETK